MSKTERYPSYAACVANALSGSRQPLTVDGLLATIADERPLGKGARSAVYRAINKLFQAVPVAPGRYGWLSHLLADATFRHPLTSEEVRRGFLLLDELEHIVFFPQFFQVNRPEDRVLTIELFGGPTIQAEASIERKTWSLRLGQEFSRWIDDQGGQSKDDLLIMVKDASAGHYEMRLNLREMRDERVIRHRNIQLALIAEELVAEDRRTRPAMPTWELVARLIGRGFFNEQPAADDLHYVLHEFSMLRFRDGLGYQLEVNDDSNLEEFSKRREFAFMLANDEGDQEMALGAEMRGWNGRRDGNDDDDERENDFSLDGLHGNGFDEDDATHLMGMMLEPEEECATYQAYLESFYQVEPNGTPVSHEDFHLLEAELELLTRLGQEFGRLLREQEERKEYLAALLFIDPNEFLEGDWDLPEGPDAEGPSPFWTN